MIPKRFYGYDWDAIAGILAAVIAIILHMLHVLDEHVILPIILVLIALLFINFMRHERSNELTAEQVERMDRTVKTIHSTLQPSDVDLVGPRQLRTTSEQFSHNMRGDSIWFNVCLSMYKPQQLFDALLRPAVENPKVKSIRFTLDESQQPLWEQHVLPKIKACKGHAKVMEPHWRQLEKNISFILADIHQEGQTEALLSFWGEPFMAQSTEKEVPRYIFHVRHRSELLTHLVELERGHRLRQQEKS